MTRCIAKFSYLLGSGPLLLILFSGLSSISALARPSQEYCDSSGDSQSSEAIARVEVGDLDHTSSASGYSDAVPASDPPNILIIIGDDMGIDTTTDLYPGLLDELYAIYGDARVYGRPAHTPVLLERIARQGIVFSNAYAQPQCSPTRAAMITGLYAAKTKVLLPGKPLDADHVNFVRMLKDEAGYSTALFGKWHLGTGSDRKTGGALPLMAGFELFRGNLAGAIDDFWDHDYQVQTDPSNPTLISSGVLPTRSLPGIAPTTYAPVVKAADAIDWINARPGPWLAWLSFNNAHTPLHVPNADTLSATALAEVVACGGIPGTNSGGSCSKPVLARTMTNAMDTAIGKVLDAVDALGTDTYVFFVGDNGMVSTSTDNMWLSSGGRGKKSVYESGTRVALAVRGPGIATGVVSEEFVHVVDLFSTCLEIGGLVPPDQNTRYGSKILVDIDSVSLTPILFDSATSVRDPDLGYVLTERQNSVGVRNRRYKLTCNGGLAACEFYDLVADPLEEIPLVTPSDCTDYESTWTTSRSQWHYCRLLEVILAESHL